ncbi:RNA polymerase sigma factor [Bacillus ndiopicus]|uniref:RNA polymerase sigma factor n=1 Tax=Bacillus ndiopicus TaxID=1347368 RepID=UPI0005AA704A|nr:RNA polymerase sigma factor [Bacillus ndiopicus]
MEQLLLKRAANGDKEAYAELVRLHYKTVEKFSFQCGVHSNDIQDITQEVFIKLYRFIEHFDKGKFTTWLYKITLNTVRDYYRKEQREKRKKDKLQQEVVPAIHMDTDDLTLHEAILALGEKYRTPIILYYFHDCKYEEIAEILSISMSTVKVRLMRAKEQLKAILQQGGVS